MQPSQDRGSLDAARQVDELCDQFESQWLAGKRPRIEDYISAAPAPLRQALFQCLVSVEAELLGKAGKAPSEADYAKRFPADAKLIAALFKERTSKKAEATETSVSTPGVPTTVSFRTPDVSLAPAQQEPIPTQIGRFKILGVLGQGAFGRVYKARDPKLDRDVALKVPKPGSFATTDDRERFLREARAAAAIRHPNICPVHDVVLDGETVYIVMAYIAGKSLADFLADRKNAVTAKQAALIVRKLAMGLHAAHAKGVVHRDLKPANILFDGDRKDVVITDFGLARRTLAGDVELTQAGAIMGTPAYMSPEQARGDSKKVGPAADIYSLGVILYELLTGTRPFKGSMGEIIGQVQHVAPQPPSKLKPGLDVRLEIICLKALAKTPQDRFGSMREFAYNLETYLKDMPTGAAVAGKPSAKPKATGPSEASQMAEISFFKELSMAIVVQCPSCNSKIKASEKHVGQNVQCPNCKHMFVVPEPVDTRISSKAMKACPYCAEMIAEAAKTCKHCHRTVDVALAEAEAARRAAEKSSGPIFNNAVGGSSSSSSSSSAAAASASSSSASGGGCFWAMVLGGGAVFLFSSCWCGFCIWGNMGTTRGTVPIPPKTDGTLQLQFAKGQQRYPAMELLVDETIVQGFQITDGKFDKHLPPGEHSVQIKLAGKQRFSKKVNVQPPASGVTPIAIPFLDIDTDNKLVLKFAAKQDTRGMEVHIDKTNMNQNFWTSPGAHDYTYLRPPGEYLVEIKITGKELFSKRVTVPEKAAGAAFVEIPALKSK